MPPTSMQSKKFKGIRADMKEHLFHLVYRAGSRSTPQLFIREKFQEQSCLQISTPVARSAYVWSARYKYLGYAKGRKKKKQDPEKTNESNKILPTLSGNRITLSRLSHIQYEDKLQCTGHLFTRRSSVLQPWGSCTV